MPKHSLGAYTYPELSIADHVGNKVVPKPRNSAGCPSLRGISHHPLFDQVEAWLSGGKGTVVLLLAK